MSSTNHTTNYNLPQWVGSDKPAWLGDVNPAFGAIDTAMKTNEVAAATATTAATTANTNIGTMANLETTAKTDLVTAINEVNTNAGVAQNTANSASANATATASALNTFEQKFNLNAITTGSPNTTGNVGAQTYTLAQNSDGSIFKFYGYKYFYGSSVINRQAVPGLSGYYGSPTGLYLTTHPTTGYVINTGTIYINNANTGVPQTIWVDNIAVGSDGQIYMFVGQSTGNQTVPSGSAMVIQYPPCIFFNGNFGDTPE